MANNNRCSCSSSSENNSSSFIFGIILGAIIGAIIAVVIYRNNKNKVIVELKEKLSQFFNQFMEKAHDFKANFSPESETVVEQKPKKQAKSDVVVEKKIEFIAPKKKNPKTFVRPKK